MDKEKTELYTDYLICNQGLATATSLSAMLDGEASHLCPRGYDQITRHLSARQYTSKDLWVDVKRTVRQIEKEDACLIFDDTVQEKASTDENEIMCWHYDHCKGDNSEQKSRLRFNRRGDNYSEKFRLWVDELEKAFAGIGGGGAGSEVATRLFGYFLSWMQDKTGAVFVLATANDISALPPELLRKGRFDEIFYVDFPTQPEREGIFKIHLEKRRQTAAKFDIKQLAKSTEGFSGADIEAVVKEAIEVAFVNNRSAVSTSHLLTVIENTHPLKEVMKTKVKEYEDKFKDLKIKSAS